MDANLPGRVRAVAISDLHLEHSYRWTPRARLERWCAEVLPRVTERVILLGDILELRSAGWRDVLGPASAFEQSIMRYLQASAYVLALPGNHDCEAHEALATWPRSTPRTVALMRDDDHDGIKRIGPQLYACHGWRWDSAPVRAAFRVSDRLNGHGTQMLASAIQWAGQRRGGRNAAVGAFRQRASAEALTLPAGVTLLHGHTHRPAMSDGIGGRRVIDCGAYLRTYAWQDEAGVWRLREFGD